MGEVSSLPSNGISHTFAIFDGPYDLNVPLPTASSFTQPVTVTFLMAFDHKGTFTWYCGSMCSKLPMELGGPMAGTVTVS